jgi:hypothetical protein
MPKTVACPHCGRPVVWGQVSPYRPFCSERCRLIDLGDWLNESYRIPPDEAGPDVNASPFDRSPEEEANGEEGTNGGQAPPH